MIAINGYDSRYGFRDLERKGERYARSRGIRIHTRILLRYSVAKYLPMMDTVTEGRNYVYNIYYHVKRHAGSHTMTLLLREM